MDKPTTNPDASSGTNDARDVCASSTVFSDTLVKQFVQEKWTQSIVPSLEEYIRVPNQSPAFDPQWATNGLLDKAADLLLAWVQAQRVPGLLARKVSVPARTPLLFLELPASPDYQGADTVLLYGHSDKQPPLEGKWADGLGPYKPVLRDGKLYGRGGADDGYAVYSAVTALQYLVQTNTTHARFVVLIESAEESGSPDLDFHMTLLKDDIGTNVSLVVCLDSGAGDYEHLWVTESLRGMLMGELKVQVLEEGIHSGTGSGIAPSSFRIARLLLTRLEDPVTGQILEPSLMSNSDAQRVVQETAAAAKLLGNDGVLHEFKWAGNTQPVSDDLVELLLNRNWRPQLEVIGADGLPSLANAGNVLRPYTTLVLSIRLPPDVEPDRAGDAVQRLLESDPPYGAQVSFTVKKKALGFRCPTPPTWLQTALDGAAWTYFDGKPLQHESVGGTIPFMATLLQRFPGVAFVVTGVLGPESNAHGPNEFLHLDFAQRITCCVAYILRQHGQRA